MKRNRNCNECQRQEVAEMVVTTATSFPDRPMGVLDQPMKHSSPSRAAHANIKSEIAKRIAVLGPLGEVRSSPASMLYRNDEKTTATVVGADRMLTLADFTEDGVTIAESRTIGSVAALDWELKLLPPAVIALKQRLAGHAQRAASETHPHLLTIGHKEERAVSASFRPLPPLPTPINFAGFANKAYRRASHSAIDVQLSTDAQNEQRAGESAENFGADVAHKTTSKEDVSSICIDLAGTPPRKNAIYTQQGTEDEWLRPHDENHVHFAEKNRVTNEHDDFMVCEDSDISTLNLDNSVDDSDPFVDDIQQQMAALSLRHASGLKRPLPPIPIGSTRRNSMPSPQEVLERLVFSSRSLHNFAQPDELPAKHSPTPQRQTPKLPSIIAEFAAFDFHLGYDRGKIGYIGRMGQKGSGADFNHDWKLEYRSRDYSKDETATGDLWENKHGFGYAGLKRHLNKLTDTRNTNTKQSQITKSPSKSLSGDGINFSSPRPNKELTIRSRRWCRNVGFPLPEPVLKDLNGAGKTNVDSIVKKNGGETQILLQSARKEKYEDVPWDKTMIGCAL